MAEIVLSRCIRVFSSSLAVIALLASACSPASTSNDAETTQGCDQACADEDTGYALITLVDGLYNQSVAGKPVGSQAVTAPCPLGGTAMITGTTALDASHGITSVNLTFAMTSCQVLANGARITVDGPMSEVGSFDGASFNSVNYASAALSIAGMATGSAIADTGCGVHIDDNSHASPAVTGTICGRPF